MTFVRGDHDCIAVRAADLYAFTDGEVRVVLCSAVGRTHQIDQLVVARRAGNGALRCTGRRIDHIQTAALHLDRVRSGRNIVAVQVERNALIDHQFFGQCCICKQRDRVAALRRRDRFRKGRNVVRIAAAYDLRDRRRPTCRQREVRSDRCCKVERCHGFRREPAVKDKVCLGRSSRLSRTRVLCNALFCRCGCPAVCIKRYGAALLDDVIAVLVRIKRYIVRSGKLCAFSFSSIVLRVKAVERTAFNDELRLFTLAVQNVQQEVSVVIAAVRIRVAECTAGNGNGILI